jgi:signal transduction histidine kinase/CheY-like chemotaxis protein
VIGRDGVETFVPPALHEQARRDFAEQIENELHGRNQMPIVTRGGGERTISWHNTTLHDDQGRACGTLSLGEDVTRHLELEEQFRHVQKMEAVGRLAGGVAHDFNNLLTVILGYAELGLLKVREEDPLHKYFDQICSASTRARTVTRQLLAFSRQQVVAPRPLELGEAIRAVEPTLRRLLGEGVRLTLELPPQTGRVHADPSQVELILVNLAINAGDAMPEGGELRIETAPVERRAPSPVEPGGPPRAWARISMTDTGAGMSAETQARIFEPFFTTKGPKRGGGLGLSTVYGTVEQCGGFVEVTSELGRGSEFRIFLPRLVEAAASEPAEPAVDRRTVAARAGESVLLVEDEDELRTLVEATLVAAGYQVLAVADGERAVRIGGERDRRIDLVVTDLVMPGLGGRQVAERLSELRPGLRFLFMSGYADRAGEWHEQIAARGQFLEKPFTPRALQAKVRELLDAAPA